MFIVSCFYVNKFVFFFAPGFCFDVLSSLCFAPVVSKAPPQLREVLSAICSVAAPTTSPYKLCTHQLI